jgi:hypothetical protein
MGNRSFGGNQGVDSVAAVQRRLPRFQSVLRIDVQDWRVSFEYDRYLMPLWIRRAFRAPCEPVPRLAQAPGVERRFRVRRGPHF